MSACPAACSGCVPLPPPARAGAGFRVVAVVGAPNSGKSALFNRLTGLRQKVANFPGVTVEHRSGVVRAAGGREVILVDLPGIHGLSGRSEDQRVTLDVLRGRSLEVARPDAILLLLDATNLERHLLLAAPILSFGLPTLVVLNMADDMRRRNGHVDTAALARQLGAPVVLASALKGEGIEEVREFLSAGNAAPPVPVGLPVLQDLPRCREWASRVGDQARYHAPSPSLWTRRLDAVFLHPFAGPLIFLLVVVAVFQTMFVAAGPLMEGVQLLLERGGEAVASVLPEGVVRSLLLEGVFGGVGSVLVFLPQILLLFLFIGVLEDSGYLARAALITDRTMARVGLEGKSFIPLLSAHACAVPAIMATRIIENKRDRLATILIAPLMTCSARLPVYTLLIAAFIPDRPVLGTFLGARALMLLGLYGLGLCAAVATARLLKSTILRSGRASFVLEMPPYRWPSPSSLGLRLLDRAKIFLRRAGTIILAAAIVLWCLAHVPLEEGRFPPIERSFAGTIGRTVEPLVEPLGFDWRIGVGLVTSLAAREVIVGTLGTLYGMDADTERESLQAAIQKDLSLGGAVALLVFFAFAMQCVSTLAVVHRETGSIKWPLLQFSYMTLIAYGGALVAHTILG